MAVGQSNIGVKIFYWDDNSYKYKYLVPLVGDLPSTGSAPATIDVTEMDSPVQQNISDRPESPSLEFSYNYNNDNPKKVAEHIDLAHPKQYLLLLPLGNAFAISGTGSTWCAGGSPVLGSFNIAQDKPMVEIFNDDEVFTEKQLKGLKDMGIKKSASTELTTADKMADLIDWSTIPSGKINEHEDEVLTAKF